MNAHIHDALREIAIETSAIVGCSICGNYDISAEDEEANSHAYAVMTEQHKNGQFRGMRLEDLRSEMKSVLLNVNTCCPSCAR